MIPRDLHPAVPEIHGGCSSYFLASPHSQAEPVLESSSKKMSVWGRQRDVPFKCLSVFPSLKPDRDFIIYNYCNFLLLSYNAKCLCGYFYTSTLLSGSWGLSKDVTCEFWVILWSHCIMNALICMWPMISCWGRTGQRAGWGGGKVAALQNVGVGMWKFNL